MAGVGRRRDEAGAPDARGPRPRGVGHDQPRGAIGPGEPRTGTGSMRDESGDPVSPARGALAPPRRACFTLDSELLDAGMACAGLA